MARTSAILDQWGSPFKANGHAKGSPRTELINALSQQRVVRLSQRSAQTYDVARDSTEFSNHWANADARDADSANNRSVRQRVTNRSRYEAGSNGYYDGILRTHANSVVGVGPKLRMQTKTRDFNQLVEREFGKWCEAVQFRRKLWCMAHARYQDGEVFAILQTNPNTGHDVQLDLMLIETEQCQSQFEPFLESGQIDGIYFDAFGNVLGYDMLPAHPGGQNAFVNEKPIFVPARDVVHWFKLDRPGGHRNVTEFKSTLNLGASSRRWREATVAGAESAAEFNVMLETGFAPEEIDDSVLNFDTMEVRKRMMTALPKGWKMSQLKAEYPTATHDNFNRSQVGEQARPVSMSANSALCDSSKSNFSSAKLDTINYRGETSVEREDCNDTVLNPVFKAWFREWTLVVSRSEEPPPHSWDWPAHQPIDEVADAKAKDIRLRNGSITLRQIYSDQGLDLEDEIQVMAEDYFGDTSPENILKMRDVLLRQNFPDAFAQEKSAGGDKQAALSVKLLEEIAGRMEALETAAGR